MKQPSVVTVDLDSTLCDNSHRQHLLKGPDGPLEQYLKYERLCGGDCLVEGVAAVVRLLGQSHALIGVSGRTEAVRGITWDWLNRHDFGFADLRLDDSDGYWFYHHSDYKAHQISKLQEEGHDVVLHLDDWSSTVESLKPLGVPVLVVRPPWSFAQNPALLQ